MATGLRRFLPSLRAPKLGLGFPAAATRSRSLHSAEKQEPRSLREEKGKPPPPKADRGKDEANRVEDMEEEGPYVNPITGEIGGPRGPEPTMHGDWVINGRCSDF